MIFISSKVSDGNMDFRFGDAQEVSKNRKKFFKKLGLKNVVKVKQIHGNKVIYADKPIHDQIEADGMITDNSSVYLMVKVADCIPIGLYDPKHNATGLIHLGWKGLEKSLIKSVVEGMKQKFGTNPKVLIVKFGPSIGPCHYRMDIWREAENQLVTSGVLRKNIDNPKICTYENKDYFSHRRSEDKNQPEGRFVTILGIK